MTPEQIRYYQEHGSEFLKLMKEKNPEGYLRIIKQIEERSLKVYDKIQWEEGK